jgi:hypothetical protein
MTAKQQMPALSREEVSYSDPDLSSVQGAVRRGAANFLAFPSSCIFISSKFIVLYMSDLNFVIVARLFNVCCRFEVKMEQNNGDFTAK